jgi:hypothetical protein
MRKMQLLLVLITLIAAVTLAAAQDQIIKAGEKADIQLNQETKVGDVVLKPGHYQIQHRVSGSDHFVQFVAFKGHSTITSSNPASVVDAGEIKCSVEPLTKKSQQTTVHMTDEAGVRRITRVEIRGDNVAHVF